MIITLGEALEKLMQDIKKRIGLRKKCTVETAENKEK